MSVLPPARNQVVSFVELVDQKRQLFGQVLQVGVHRHHKRIAGGTKSGGERGRLAEIPTETNVANRRVGSLDLFQRFERAVGASVVDKNHFVMNCTH